MSDTKPMVHEGFCFCGAVRIAATGAPFAMGYCHCQDCRAWSASPVSSFTLWARDAVAVTQGADSLGSYSKTGVSHRHFCRHCGGNLMTDCPELGFTDVYADLLPTLDFQPQMHINYASTVLRLRDGLPKHKDFPAEAGGSGEMLDE